MGYPLSSLSVWNEELGLTRFLGNLLERILMG